MSKIISAILLFFFFNSAYAFDLYFTVSYQTYPIAGAPDNEGRDVVYEKKVIHINTQDDSAEIFKIKKAYSDHVKSVYPAYIDRVMRSRERDRLDRHLFNNIYVAAFGSAAKAKADREYNMKHARELGFTVVESDRFDYRP